MRINHLIRQGFALIPLCAGVALAQAPADPGATSTLTPTTATPTQSPIKPIDAEPIPAYHLVVVGEALQLTPEQQQAAIDWASAFGGGTITSFEYRGGLTPAEQAAEFPANTEPVGAHARQPDDGTVDAESPVDDAGNPLPPPVKLPDGTNGQPNDWKQVPGTRNRPIKWVPRHPIPTTDGGQPGASWDPDNDHWDVDKGNGERIRVRPDGTLVDHDNNPQPDQTIPDPFTGLDPAIIAAFAAIGTVAVIIGIIIYVIFSIFGGWGLAMLAPGTYMPPPPPPVVVLCREDTIREHGESGLV